MAVHQYQLAELAAFTVDLGNVIRELREQLEAASQAVAAIRGDYDAASAERFEETFKSWSARVSSHLEALVDFQVLVDNSHKNYSEAEQLNAAMFGGGKGKS